MFFVLYALGLVNVILSRCSKLIAYMNLIKRLCFQMPFFSSKRPRFHEVITFS